MDYFINVFHSFLFLRNAIFEDSLIRPNLLITYKLRCRDGVLVFAIIINTFLIVRNFLIRNVQTTLLICFYPVFMFFTHMNSYYCSESHKKHTDDSDIQNGEDNCERSLNRGKRSHNLLLKSHEWGYGEACVLSICKLMAERGLNL
jgi:hypothetical protein